MVSSPVSGRYLGFAVLVTLLMGCNSSADSSVFSAPGGTQTKPVASQIKLNTGDAGALGATAAPTLAASVTYVIVVTSNSGDEVCHGTAEINIMSNFTMQFPQAKITCLTLNIDLAGILGNSFASGGSLSNLSSDGKVLYIAQIANATFTPPRPFLLGPVIQDPSIYQGYHVTIPESVAVADGTLNTTATGSFDLAVLAVGTTYSNTLSPKNNFSNVLDWRITTSGFAGIPSKDGLLMKSMEWFWNTQPIMIPKIVIKGSLSDFISSNGSGSGSGSGGGSSGASQLIGDITIDLSVQSYDFGT